MTTARRRQWPAAQPRVLGVSLDGVVSALQNKDELEASMDTSPRMGDFLLWAAAAAPAFGWTAKDVIEAYEQNREGATAVALDNQAIYPYLRTVVRQHGGKWRGTAAKLLVLLQGAGRNGVCSHKRSAGLAAFAGCSRCRTDADGSQPARRRLDRCGTGPVRWAARPHLVFGTAGGRGNGG